MITADYYDGDSTHRHIVSVLFHRGILAFDGEGVRGSVRLSKVRVSEPLGRAPRILLLPGGGRLEISDSTLPRLLHKNGYRESRVVRWQRNWPMSLLALVTLVVSLIAGYQWGLPAAADAAAQRLPESLARRIGDEQLKLVDRALMSPSRLDAGQRTRIEQRFARMVQPGTARTPYRIEFRHSRQGQPNAYALPNGVILMTDQLVELAGNDEAVLGVLGHELGHVQRRHSLRGILQAVGLGVVMNVLVGDVSTVLAAAPVFLLDQAYSRDFEREADDFAIAMMRVNGVPLSPMADLFERMGEDEAHTAKRRPADRQGVEEGEELVDYLSSHPSNAERIARFRAADARR